ncbi:MAG: MFS transporter [Candidatus Thorarchaeota archaeon]|nr:MFS transporter [Candidatus Thorarchaeota archaeon]
MAKVTKASYAVLIACTVSHFMNHVYTGVLSPFLPLIRDEFGLSLTEAGILTTAVILTMTSAHLVVGYLGDKGLRDIFISISVLLAGVVMLVASFATSFLFLVGTQIALGLGVSGYHPSAFPAISGKFPKTERAKAVGLNTAGGLVGMAIIPFLGVALLVIFDWWREPIYVLGLMGIALFFPVLIMMRYASKQTLIDEANGINNEKPKETIGWTRNFWVVMIFMGLRGIPFRCTTLMMPIYLVDSYGYEPVWAGSLTAIMLSAGLFGELASAPISDRSGKRVPYMILSVASMVPLFLFLNLSLDPLMLFIVLIAIGFIYFFGVPPGQAYETEVCPTERQGLAFGLLFSIGAIPGSLSPMIFGWIGDNFGLTSSILFLAIISGLAVLIGLFLRDLPSEKHEPVTIAFEE